MMAEAVAKYLAAQGLGTFNATVFHSHFRDDPDDIVCCLDETAPEFSGSGGLALDQTGVQILTRAKRVQDARDRAWSVHRALVGFGGGQLDAAFPQVGSVSIVTSPAPVDRDTNDRVVYSAHYAVLFVSEGDAHRQ